MKKNTQRSKQMHQMATNLEWRDCQMHSQQFQPPRVLHALCSVRPGSCPLCLWWLLGREQLLNTQQWTSVSAMQTSQQNGTGQLSGDSSVVRAPVLWLKGCGFESLLERRENFLLQGWLSVLTLISVSVPSPCYRTVARKRLTPVILPNVQVAG